MIDWVGVGAGALWIMGLAVILAALSRAHWLARLQRLRFRAVVGTSPYQVACNAGLALVCTGLSCSARSLWERVAWAAFGLFYAALAFAEWRKGSVVTAAVVGSGACHKKKATEVATTNSRAVNGHKGLGYGDTLGAAKHLIATWVQQIELWWVLAAIPFLLFPGQYSPWALAAIALLWLLRLATTGRLTVRTPVDWPLFAFLLVLPVTWWASADHGLTLAALYRLLAGMALFHSVVNWATTPQRLLAAAAVLTLCGVGLAALAPLAATAWGSAKLFNALPILTRLQMHGKPLIGEDINANVLGGGLILVWPVVASLLLAHFDGSDFVPNRRQLVVRTLRPPALKRPLQTYLIALCLAAALLGMTAILLLTQSRGALLGLGLAVLVMAALRWRWVRYGAPFAGLALAVWLWRGGAPKLRPWADALFSTGTVASLSSRLEVWSRAIYMLQDFPFTGIGLGTFDRVQPLLYPFFLSAGEVHHAHNLFLQVGVDLGLPGLIAYLALLLGSLCATWHSYYSPLPQGEGLGGEGPGAVPPRVDGVRANLALGLLGSQVAWVAHGMLDAGVWASKLAFLPWFVLGLAIALGQVNRCAVAHWRLH